MAPDYSAKVTWPTGVEVSNAVLMDLQNPHKKEPFFFWEDHSWETPHPTIVDSRKFRQLCVARTINKAISRRETEKHHHYVGTGHTVVPLVATSGGCLSVTFRMLIHQLCIQLDPDGKKIGRQARFCRKIIGRLSIITTRSLVRLAYLESPRAWSVL